MLIIIDMVIKGERLRELRLSKNISQFRLGLELDMTQQQINKIEHNCYKRLYFCTVYKIAKYFNVKMEELI